MVESGSVPPHTLPLSTVLIEESLENRLPELILGTGGAYPGREGGTDALREHWNIHAGVNSTERFTFMPRYSRMCIICA